MANITSKPRVGYVHPKEATGMSAKEAALEAGAGNVTAEPPALQEFANPKPSVSAEDYPTPRDSGGMADGETGGNYEGIGDGKLIPNLQVKPGEGMDEE